MSNLSIAVRGDAPNRYRQDSPPLLSWPGGRLTRSSAAHDTDRTGGAVADTARGRGEGNPPGAQPRGGDPGGRPLGDCPSPPGPGPATGGAGPAGSWAPRGESAAGTPPVA